MPINIVQADHILAGIIDSAYFRHIMLARLGQKAPPAISKIIVMPS